MSFVLTKDTIQVGSSLGAFSIALNNGAGVVASHLHHDYDQRFRLVAGDFAVDGKPDLMVLNATNFPLFALYVNATP